MDSIALTAISPVDGRYRKITEPLAPYFSEEGLFRYRIRVEIEYFIFISTLKLPQFPEIEPGEQERLRSIYIQFSREDALRIKSIEKITNHDVKAVEYFIKEKLSGLSSAPYKEFIHFGLTSQDINNTAIPLLLKESMNDQVLPLLNQLIDRIGYYRQTWKTIPMLARTHGQPASPTLLGKEFGVFHERLKSQRALLDSIPFHAKFGGATGGFNAHYLAYPAIDWDEKADQLLRFLGLQRSKPTTQIDHYDHLAAYCDNLKRINTILIDFCRDMWHYISIEYFKQKISENEVGSSTMPHKVNPIDFENAEGNLGYANAILEFFSSKLPISRLQRDLTDSTVLRNIGIPIAHSFIAYCSILKGMEKLQLNEKVMHADLDNNWAVISEGIQTILRRSGFPEPYEALKKLTRNHTKITREIIHQFIDDLNVEASVKEELKKLSPFNYTGK